MRSIPAKSLTDSPPRSDTPAAAHIGSAASCAPCGSIKQLAYLLRPHYRPPTLAFCLDILQIVAQAPVILSISKLNLALP